MSEPLALLFVDTETTGLIDDKPDSEITEIAVVKWCDGETEELLHSLVRPKKTVPDPKYNKSYDPAAHALADSWDVQASIAISEMLKGQLICGSNPDFDKRMIAAECFRTGQPRPQWGHRGVNTASLGMMLWIMGETPGCGLVDLAKYFGVEHAAHTALGDCKAAIGVWEAFFDRFIFRPKVMLEALEDILNLDGKLNLDVVRDIALRGTVGDA